MIGVRGYAVPGAFSWPAAAVLPDSFEAKGKAFMLDGCTITRGGTEAEMETARRLEELQKELQSLRGMLLLERDAPAEKKIISLRGMGRLLVSEEELEEAIDNAKRSVFSGVKDAVRH